MPLDLTTIRNALGQRTHREASVREDTRFAAVAAVLRELSNGVDVLLIRRTENANDPWSGHMAFPGGRRDATDENLLATAIRETHEETGLRLDPTAHLVGRLDDLPAISQGRRISMIIAPFVFAVPFDPELTPAIDEVAEVHWAPLDPMQAGQTDALFEYRYGQGKIHLPAFRVNERLVWGLTHRMLVGLFDTLDGGNRCANLPY